MWFHNNSFGIELLATDWLLINIYIYKKKKRNRFKTSAPDSHEIRAIICFIDHRRPVLKKIKFHKSSTPILFDVGTVFECTSCYNSVHYYDEKNQVRLEVRCIIFPSNFQRHIFSATLEFGHDQDRSDLRAYIRFLTFYHVIPTFGCATMQAVFSNLWRHCTLFHGLRLDK